jgi:hypothetical protein
LESIPSKQILIVETGLLSSMLSCRKPIERKETRFFLRIPAMSAP